MRKDKSLSEFKKEPAEELQPKEFVEAVEIIVVIASNKRTRTPEDREFRGPGTQSP